MNQVIKEINGQVGTRSSFPDITEQFRMIANWNTYSRGNIVSNDKGVKYQHMGTINNAILVQKLAD